MHLVKGDTFLNSGNKLTTVTKVKKNGKINLMSSTGRKWEDTKGNIKSRLDRCIYTNYKPVPRDYEIF